MKLLRTNTAAFTGAGQSLNMDQSGWIDCSALEAALLIENPGLRRFSIDAILKLVAEDKYWRMQMFVSRNPTAVTVNDFVKVRAVSGHADECNIDYRTFYPPRLRFEREGSERGSKGPKHVFFYTNLKGLHNIWDSNGIRPDTSPFGSHSKSFVYCCPVPLSHKHCPDGCMIYSEYAQVMVILDFHMIMDDNHECFYAYDG